MSSVTLSNSPEKLNIPEQLKNEMRRPKLVQTIIMNAGNESYSYTH